MQVFKTAIKTVLRHPMYLIVYAGFLSMMGVFIASGLTFGGTNDSEFSPYETKFAVIDRDGSALSDGLAAYLREQGIEVPIEDSQMALQDAVAKGQSSYILIVPEGFGDAFVEAARTGDELPTLETVYSFYSTEGSLMDQMVNSYLGIAGAYAGLEGSASQGDIVQHAAEAMAESAETDSVRGAAVRVLPPLGHLHPVRLHHRVRRRDDDHAQPHRSAPTQPRVAAAVPVLRAAAGGEQPAGHDGGVAVDDLFGIHRVP